MVAAKDYKESVGVAGNGGVASVNYGDGGAGGTVVDYSSFNVTTESYPVTVGGGGAAVIAGTGGSWW